MIHWTKIEGVTIKRTLSVIANPQRYYSNTTKIFKSEILRMLLTSGNLMNINKNLFIFY